MPRICVLLAISASVLLTDAHAGTIDAIDAFGDSLSDVGNIFNLTGGAEPAPPYVNGQFSNGNVWVQDVALELGLAPLTPSLLGGTDYAYGSGQTGSTLYNTAGLGDLFDLDGPSGQIAQFAKANPTGADPNALYTIWIGANDLAAIPGVASPADIAMDIGAIVENIDAAINTLAGLGAKNFLVVTVPDLGLTPDALTAGTSAAASALSAGLDGVLVNGSSPIPSLAAIAAGDAIDISVLNTYLLLDSIVANPARYGFTDVTDPCLTGEVDFAGGTPCATPNQYLFWDGDHPTAAGQAVIADAALALVTPEPASAWLITGGLFGLAGLFLLRRRHLPRDL
ncbi:MAG TPA: SGNH/GDSL hydrolase family protein [Bryobacteraceae bacterium]